MKNQILLFIFFILSIYSSFAQDRKYKIVTIADIVGKEYFFNTANGIIASLNFGTKVNDILGDHKELSGGIRKRTWVYDKYAVTLYTYPNTKFWILITNLEYFQL